MINKILSKIYFPNGQRSQVWNYLIIFILFVFFIDTLVVIYQNNVIAFLSGTIKTFIIILSIYYLYNIWYGSTFHVTESNFVVSPINGFIKSIKSNDNNITITIERRHNTQACCVYPYLGKINITDNKTIGQEKGKTCTSLGYDVINNNIKFHIDHYDCKYSGFLSYYWIEKEINQRYPINENNKNLYGLMIDGIVLITLNKEIFKLEIYENQSCIAGETKLASLI